MRLDPDLAKIQAAVRQVSHRFSLHALQRMSERGIADGDISEATMEGEIIERYPEDKYGPSVLLCGRNSNREPFHIQWSTVAPFKVITAYRPDPLEWDDELKNRVGKVNEDV